MRLMNDETDSLDATFAALADPTRRAILRRLTSGEASVGELVEPFSMTQPAISKHLKVLETAGLISRRPEAQRRMCRIEPAQFQHATRWLLGYREFWTGSFDELDTLLAELQSDEGSS